MMPVLHVVEGAHELGAPARGHAALLGEARRVVAERHAADAVEREAFQHVLHVQRPAIARRALEQRQQPLGDLEPDRVDDEAPERALAELVAGGLALPQPLLAVGVEDATPEEVLDHGHRDLALGVVGEVGLEDVLDVGRVGGLAVMAPPVKPSALKEMVCVGSRLMTSVHQSRKRSWFLTIDEVR